MVDQIKRMTQITELFLARILESAIHFLNTSNPALLPLTAMASYSAIIYILTAPTVPAVKILPLSLIRITISMMMVAFGQAILSWNLLVLRRDLKLRLKRWATRILRSAGRRNAKLNRRRKKREIGKNLKGHKVLNRKVINRWWRWQRNPRLLSRRRTRSWARPGRQDLDALSCNYENHAIVFWDGGHICWF